MTAAHLYALRGEGHGSFPGRERWSGYGCSTRTRRRGFASAAIDEGGEPTVAAACRRESGLPGTPNGAGEFSLFRLLGPTDRWVPYVGARAGVTNLSRG